jgi:teichoic acid transport system ATP-binding protein
MQFFKKHEGDLQMSCDTASVLVAAEVEKSYRIFSRPADRLRQYFLGKRRTLYREFHALHKVTFSLARGECIAFVGENGSGKSTLLQILAGTLQPSRGKVAVHGRVVALLELGAGFNPEFTGRENVLLNAAIMGFSEGEIRARQDEIFEFSGIQEFIDMPVKTYSSGMYVRLAFAIAVSVNPEVLIVDEALAVGDAAFQYKCLQRIKELQEQGTGIIYVTHDTISAKQIADRVGWLDHGHLRAFGEAISVITEYESFLRTRMGERVLPKLGLESARDPHARAVIRQASFYDGRGDTLKDQITFGTKLQIKIAYEVLAECGDGFLLGVAMYRNDGTYVCGIHTGLDNFAIPHEIGNHSATVIFEELRVISGEYFFNVGIFDKSGLVRWDFHHAVATFCVSGPYNAEGVVALAHQWKL